MDSSLMFGKLLPDWPGPSLTLRIVTMWAKDTEEAQA
jgi:hypothetical protein